MKLSFTLAALLLCAPCAPMARAQTAATPPAPLAQIDTAALNLLARLSWKYRRTKSYNIRIKIKENNRPAPGRFATRVRADMNQFVWSQWSPDEQWRKWIFDSKTAIAYDSRFPKRYTKREFGDFESLNFTSTFESLGLKPAILMRVMSGDWPGKLLSHPDLCEISMSSNGSQKIVTLAFRSEDSFEGKDDYIRFFIDPQTLLLKRIVSRQTLINGDKTSELLTEETYSQVGYPLRFQADWFDTRPPLNYKISENFAASTARY